ncbi:Polyketide cyclase / dehydrase and lipid transport [Roseivivax jejudonensis]|uniref:Polyketide cyclase / dehydrase and lipid transport n=1 Tax=Roseivivax jejudonensis TaxID=1529041 RepID=A0A1X6ZJ81_9RHOB|nr:SRPBCC family protein [Roseivivax jejudonensis]SLN52755.1 Polyketide cyclase / dehydrase and lipid transport [Roseivivax jejudonensis]
MKLSVKEDIEGPLDRVFAHLSDLEALERSAMRRGVEVRRVDDRAEPGPGMTWEIAFRYRGRRREASIVMTEFTPPHRMAFDSASGGLEIATVVDLVALSRTRTRVALDVTLLPRTLSARLLVQSMKFARGSIDRRMKQRATEFSRDLETRLKRAG